MQQTRWFVRLAALLLATLPGPVLAEMRGPDPVGDVAWDIVAGLTTDVGQRMAGTEAEARARTWAVAKLGALGFAKVHVEPFRFPGYVRGADAAELVAPLPQALAITALGYSAPTSAKGITAEVTYFPSMEALAAAPAGSLAGRIAFIDHAMRADAEGSGYGPYGAARRSGPQVAMDKGAIATVIRSIGTENHRTPHTGRTYFTDAHRAIPAMAVSNPDADLIARLARAGKPMRMHLVTTGHSVADMPSGNVVADLPGRDPSLPAVLVACHLDSWDLASGAIDDGAGCAIVTAAALKASEGGKLLRTIRVLWAGSEEPDGYGGKAYAKSHAADPHAFGMESDFGADRVWKARLGFAAADKALADKVAAALAPLGVTSSAGVALGGEDAGPLIIAQKLPGVGLQQDGTRYFDIHHSPDDTLDKIDPVQLDQNVAAWAAVLRVVGEAPSIARLP